MISARSSVARDNAVGKWWAGRGGLVRKPIVLVHGLRRDCRVFAKPLDWETGLGGSNPPSPLIRRQEPTKPRSPRRLRPGVLRAVPGPSPPGTDKPTPPVPRLRPKTLPTCYRGCRPTSPKRSRPGPAWTGQHGRRFLRWSVDGKERSRAPSCGRPSLHGSGRLTRPSPRRGKGGPFALGWSSVYDLFSACLHHATETRRRVADLEPPRGSEAPCGGFALRRGQHGVRTRPRLHQAGVNRQGGAGPVGADQRWGPNISRWSRCGRLARSRTDILPKNSRLAGRTFESGSAGPVQHGPVAERSRGARVGPGVGVHGTTALGVCALADRL